MSTVNIPTTFYDTTIVTTRQAEVPDADFTGGCNPGSCQCGLGINTGNKNPKESDWSTPQTASLSYPGLGQYIGIGSGSNSFLSLWDNDTASSIANTWYAEATVNAADGAIYNAAAASGAGVINRTGAPVVIGDKLWGEAA